MRSTERGPTDTAPEFEFINTGDTRMKKTDQRKRAPVAVIAIFTVAAGLAAGGLFALGDEPEVKQEKRVVVIKGENEIPIVKKRVVFAGEQGFLGVHLVDVTPELRAHFGAPQDSGVLIGRVEEDSPADKAGLQVGDLLSAIDGETVSEPFDVARRIGSGEEGQSVSLEVWRDETKEMLTAVLEVREAIPQSFAWRQLHAGEEPFLALHGEGVDVDELIEIDKDEILLKMDELRILSPHEDTGHRVMEFRSYNEKLEERLKELEQQLEEMREQLEALDEDS